MKNCQKSGKEQPADKLKHHKIKLKISVTGVIRNEQHQHQGAAFMSSLHRYRVVRHCAKQMRRKLYIYISIYYAIYKKYFKYSKLNLRNKFN